MSNMIRNVTYQLIRRLKRALLCAMQFLWKLRFGMDTVFSYTWYSCACTGGVCTHTHTHIYTVCAHIYTHARSVRKHIYTHTCGVCKHIYIHIYVVCVNIYTCTWCVYAYVYKYMRGNLITLLKLTLKRNLLLFVYIFILQMLIIIGKEKYIEWRIILKTHHSTTWQRSLRRIIFPFSFYARERRYS